MGLQLRPRMEMLDRRDVPSTVLVDHQSYSLTGPPGSATVTLTVTDEDDGYYHWDYVLQNGSFDEPGTPTDTYIGMFVLPVADPSEISNLWNSMGWTAQVGDFVDGTAAVWGAGEFGTQIVPGSSGEFKFTTPMVPIDFGSGQAADPQYANAAVGQVLAPVATNSATLDFSNATTGKAYSIAIYILSGDTVLVDTTINITAIATTSDIRDAVKAACVQAGLYVDTAGANKLVIGGKPNLPVTSIALDNGQVVQGRFQVDTTIKGPSLVQWTGDVAVKVNGTRLNP